MLLYRARLRCLTARLTMARISAGIWRSVAVLRRFSLRLFGSGIYFRPGFLVSTFGFWCGFSIPTSDFWRGFLGSVSGFCRGFFSAPAIGFRCGFSIPASDFRCGFWGLAYSFHPAFWFRHPVFGGRCRLLSGAAFRPVFRPRLRCLVKPCRSAFFRLIHGASGK